jgi:hypothetical protein|tara:strand:+ start:308 stop:709 length:402 start_codon:yes stop_codon:yes gene_type:complete
MSNKFGKILAEISVGELFDKITILQIKKSKIKDKNKLSNVEKELNSLNETLDKNGLKNTDEKLKNLVKDLAEINEDLWNIEEGKRLSEKNNDFGENFIKLSREVYKKNDTRAKIKLEINNYLGSNIKEVKSHS